MIQLCIWADESMKSIIHQELVTIEDYRITSSFETCDIFIVDISNPCYAVERIVAQLRSLPKEVILIILTSDSSPLFDFVGVYVYQFILHEEIHKRLGKCFQQVQTYLQTLHCICIHSKGESFFLALHDILYVRIEDTIVYINALDKEYMTQFTSLEKVKAVLNDNFIFVNRSTMVNIAYVTSLTHKEVRLHTMSFPLSRRRKTALFSLFEKRGNTI